METILHQLALDLQRKWGVYALQPASQLVQQRHTLATGIPDLDISLGGGIPLATLTHLEGDLTSGKTTLALQILAQQPLAIYLDVSRTFDPGYANHVGIDLDHLLLARPDDAETASHIAQAIIVRHDPPTLVLDLGLTPLTSTLMNSINHLMTHLRQSHCALILLTESTWCHLNASIHLTCQRTGWLWEHGTVTGYTTTVHVNHQLNGMSDQRIPFTVDLPEAVP